MNHSFNPSLTDDKLCSVCKRDFTMHTNSATCESCDRERCNVELHDNIAMCHACQELHRESMKHVISDSRAIDSSLRYNGDFFNAATIPTIELKHAIDSDESLSADEKQWKFQATLAERYEHFKDVVFLKEEEVHQAKLQLLHISKTLREFGDNVRKEVRERIKQADEKYIPQVAKGIPKVKVKEKLSPMENMILSIMNTAKENNKIMTREQAIELITKGK